MARQFVYFMQGLSKTYPGNRKILENVHLSFYPDAKIGVLGVNGSGKSTLLKIMAGLDKEYSGEAGDPRPLQRADDELLRRDRGGSLKAAGPDRLAKPLGP